MFRSLRRRHLVNVNGAKTNDCLMVTHYTGQSVLTVTAPKLRTERFCWSSVLLPTYYRCLYGLAPWYLSDHIQLVADSNRRRLRSSSSMQLVIQHTRLSTVGDHAFPVAGCRLWNSQPSDVTSAPTLTVFRNRLKTRLFSRSFPS